MKITGKLTQIKAGVALAALGACVISGQNIPSKVAGSGPIGQVAVTHNPMTNPQAVLAQQDMKYGHSVSWVELSNGDILMTGSGKFRVSKDKGLTWSEEFHGTDENGKRFSTPSLVNLSGGAIGGISMNPTPGSKTLYAYQMFFRRSEDGGKTWSRAVHINPRDQHGFYWQDMMMRTSTGRIIIPVYNSLAQPGFHMNGSPNAGGFIRGFGPFVSTDAHFFDPGFSASYVYYSDDEGKTWRQSRGEIIVHVEPGGQIEWTAEPSVAEVSPRNLIMILRTRLGRHYESRSTDDGRTWGPAKPTQLAGTQNPAQIRQLRGKAKGHMLVVFNQQSEEDIKRGMIRTRLSSAISRNQGRLWEHFQNVESMHDEPYVEAGPIAIVRPEGVYPIEGGAATENDSRYAGPLPEGYGRWAYPSVLVLEDRVLISHTYAVHDPVTGDRPSAGTNRIKVLPLSWFYGGVDPFENNAVTKLSNPPQP